MLKFPLLQTCKKSFVFAVLCAALPAHASTADKIYGGLFLKHRKSSAEQKRSRTNTSVMGVRGLDSDSESGKKLYATANMRAVYQMEDRTPDDVLLAAIRDSVKQQQSTVHSSIQRLTNEAPTLTELEAEVELGRKMAAQILGSYRVVDSEEIQKYVLALASVVAEGGLKSPRPFRLAVIQSPIANAFACPGGYIFVTLGALKSVKNESELAALLGHEIVHVSQRHLLSSLKKKVTDKKNKSDGRNSDVYLSARKRIKPETSAEKSNWSTLLGPKGVGLTLLQASSEALDTLFSKGLEQEFELEADSLGSRVSAVAGYSADSLLSLLKGLSTGVRKTTVNGNSTHPPLPLRIERLEQFLSPFKQNSAQTLSSSKPFEATQKLWTAL